MQLFVLNILYIFKSIKNTRTRRKMAVLLAMYQKMKLIRQINEDTLKLTRISSKIDRVTKNIEKTQKRFTSLFAQIDKQAQMMQSQATMIFQNMAGLGMNNFANSINPYGFSGINGFIMQNANAFMTGRGIPYQTGTDENDKPTYDYYGGLSQDKIRRMWEHYNSHGGRFVPKTEKDEKGNYNTIYRQDGDEEFGQYMFGVQLTEDQKPNEQIPMYDGFTAEDVQLFNAAIQQAQMQQQQAQMWVQQANTQYGQNVSIWAQAAKAQLEAQQDAALEPLNYEDTMLQLEKEHLDARLQRLRAEKESYDTLVGEEAKNMAPTFGLR